MNEEQLADALTQHLDALLAGDPLPDQPPEEIAQLLALAEALEPLAPQARPEFGVSLKHSLLNKRPLASSGATLGGLLSVFVVIILGGVVASLLVAGGVAWRIIQAEDSVLPSPA